MVSFIFRMVMTLRVDLPYFIVDLCIYIYTLRCYLEVQLATRAHFVVACL